jgi:hypothetical protein
MKSPMQDVGRILLHLRVAEAETGLGDEHAAPLSYSFASVISRFRHLNYPR